MPDENNNNSDGVLISKPTGHHNQLYVLIYTFKICLLSRNYPSLMDIRFLLFNIHTFKVAK